MFDRFLVTFPPTLCGLRELDRDLRLCALSSETSSPASLGIFAVDCGVAEALFARFLKIAATDTDFLTGTGVTCFAGDCMLR